MTFVKKTCRGFGKTQGMGTSATIQ